MPYQKRLKQAVQTTHSQTPAIVDNSAASGSSPLLSLPPELLERIIGFALGPHNIAELGKPHPHSHASKGPRKLLLERRLSMTACKELYQMVIPAYFHTTRLTAVIGDGWGCQGKGVINQYGLTYPAGYSATVLYGTFTDHSLYYANTARLRIELEEYDPKAVVKVADIMRKCRKLRDVTFCLRNLTIADEDLVWKELKWQRQKIDEDSSGMQYISIRKESREDYLEEIAIGEAADNDFTRFTEIYKLAEDMDGFEWPQATFCCARGAEVAMHQRILKGMKDRNLHGRRHKESEGKDERIVPSHTCTPFSEIQSELEDTSELSYH